MGGKNGHHPEYRVKGEGQHHVARCPSLDVPIRLSMVENGKDTPSLKLVDKIAAILDVKVEDLFKM